ncbi:unnamed protein product [Enterobius vermicularis]|uniref:C-type lectin domain-containing protein n=1 Tax=Enterobius vermicularis TaxID=51028 RepID=A0A158QAB3_ENTVE|nr:unnamed protein product [Enterobius vermicularis]
MKIRSYEGFIIYILLLLCHVFAEEPENECPEWWHRTENYCYSRIEDRYTYDDAEEHCKKKEARLPTFLNKKEFDALLRYLRAPRNYWFGAKLQDKLLWNWTDGTPLQLSEISLPIFGLGNFSCAVLSQKGVQTVECTTYQNAICKRPKRKLFNQLNNLEYPKLNCFPGWDELEQNCYLLSTQGFVHGAAVKFCENNEANLATVFSKEEEEFLKTLLGNKSAYIGLDHISTRKNAWIPNVPDRLDRIYINLTKKRNPNGKCLQLYYATKQMDSQICDEIAELTCQQESSVIY